MAENAQETFKRMMREEVAPALRTLGLKGSGQTYTLPSDTCWALMGFQKFTISNSTNVQFTINLSVVSKAAWNEARLRHPYLGKQPSANMSGHRTWETRLGPPRHKGQGKGWSLAAGFATVRLAEEVITTIRDIGLPAMQEQIREADAQSRA